ncbi:MAG: translation initiation factor IF-2 subunit gamma [Candidatus Aenigmatarchaeota archaeon]
MKEVKDEKLIPEVNVGLAGHVAHGKTTLVEALTKKLTLTHSEELKRGITIRLGYADSTFYKCVNCGRYSTTEKCPYCFSDCEILRTVSFIDVPGHETLMATVLTATSIMDGAVLVIAANEKCPQPQTREHLAALEVAGIKNVVIVQNKIDLVSRERALESYQEIKKFIEGTIIQDSPIIPVSAQQRANIDLVIKAIEEKIPTPKREEGKDLKMFVARSFDVNKPGTEIKELLGGILGGSILQGKVRVGEEIEILPGIKVGEKYKSLITKVEGLQKAKRNLEEAGPGGLVGILTTLDPYLTKSDSLVGNVVGLPGKLSRAMDKIEVQVKLLERLVGTKEVKEITPIKPNEELLINVGTARTIGIVDSVKRDFISLKLKIPVYVEKNERIVISRNFSGRWRLIGYGNVV